MLLHIPFRHRALHVDKVSGTGKRFPWVRSDTASSWLPVLSFRLTHPGVRQEENKLAAKTWQDATALRLRWNFNLCPFCVTHECFNLCECTSWQVCLLLCIHWDASEDEQEKRCNGFARGEIHFPHEETKTKDSPSLNSHSGRFHLDAF